MSKMAMWGLVVVVVLVGGYFALNQNKSENALLNNNQEATEENTPNIEVTENTEATGKKMAFADFIRMDKGSYRCTVDQYVGDIDSTGVTYVNNGMVRGDFNTKVQGMSIDSSIIMRDGYSYVWSSALPNVGYKSKVPPSSEIESSTEIAASGQYSFNAEQIGDYDCKVWGVDQSKFTLPSTVVFQELKVNN